ncbi:FKBP-type peptidyl-prolyl cis-trans isomerase [Bacteroidia bacterium]|nr:FKBP-type peptidyl-prolyl cis-trans isomerase [Bacteroidia bacterium]MDC1395063.1 FKBP-type peptidyl-prolyl cis-trans isomerase [Bacteroidia bacterium]
MKKTIILASVIVLFGACGQKSGLTIDTTKATELATELDSVSYLLGSSYAKGLKSKGGVTELDNKSFLSGMQRVFEDKEVEISEEDANSYMSAYFAKIEEAKGATAKMEGEAYCEANKVKEGVQVTASGLQYKVVTEGNGAIPTKEDKVKVHYTGKLVDGKVFDSSVERGEPIEFATTGVIPGWTEALLMMPVGSKWELVIPSDLAYGARGTGPIPGNATLIFDVELLDIVK